MKRRSLRQRTEWLREDLKDAIRIDIEADGLLDDVTRIHCVWTYDPVTDEWQDYRDNVVLDPSRSYVAHNGIGYDYPVLQKFGLLTNPTGYLHDTLRYVQLFKPAPVEVDGERHSLRAWGKRLKVHKGDYAGGWDEWSPEMHDYCRQDVLVQDALVKYLVDQEPLWTGLGPAGRELFYRWTDHMMAGGVRIDRQHLEEMHVVLASESMELEEKLQSIIPPKVEYGKRPQWYENPETGDRRRNKKDFSPKERKTLVNGPPKEIVTPFNPRSPKWKVEWLTEGRGWIPTKFTKKTEKGGGGNPKVDRSVLTNLEARGWPEVPLLLEYSDTDKLRQALKTDTGGILTAADKNDIVRFTIVPSGANTHRCAHKEPNLANVPARTERGLLVRKGFIARPGRTIVGYDAKGLEMGGLGHYLSPFDGGAWSRMFAAAETAEKYTEGDPHWRTCLATGLADREEHFSTIDENWKKAARNQGKTTFYAFLYGAGDTRLGEAWGPSREDLIEASKRNPAKVRGVEASFEKHEGRKAPEFYGALAVIGERVRERLLAGIDGLDSLLESIHERVEDRGYLVGIDGRPLWARSKHSRLNLLVQSWGAIVVEYATVIAHETYRRNGLVPDRDFNMILHVHDEWQDDIVSPAVEDAIPMGLAAFPAAGELLQVDTAVVGDAAQGRTWMETH